MQSLKTEIGAEIRNVNGEIIRRIPFRRCHSLLKQFVQILAIQMSQTSRSIKTTPGTIFSLPAHALNLKANATAETNFGIVIGSGETNAVTMEDYKLETQLITNIAHQTVVFAGENPNAETWRLAISRGFVNNTGAQVAVKETGIYVRVYNYYACIDRTLYPVTFEAGETLTLTYRIVITL